jgi:hypothetical protein
MRGTVRRLRVVQWTMLGSIVLYAVVGKIISFATHPADSSLSYVFTTAGVALVGMIFVVRRTLVLRPAEDLSSRPDDSISLSHWKSGYIATYALCEALALLGLVLRFLGFSFQQSLPFYVASFVLLLFFGPRKPISV